MFLFSFLLLTYHLVWFHFRVCISEHVCDVAFGMYCLLAIPFSSYGQKNIFFLNTFQPNLCFVPCRPMRDVSEIIHQPGGSIVDTNLTWFVQQIVVLELHFGLFSSKLCSEKNEILFNHVFVLFDCVPLIQPLKMKWLCICTFSDKYINAFSLCRGNTQPNIMHAQVYFRWFAKITMHKTSRAP